MDTGDDGSAATGAGPLPTRALTRESERARRLLDAGHWHPAPADTHALAAVLARLAAPLPTRKHPSGRTRLTDRDRRLHRVLRSAVHHLDAGAVDPPAAALLAAVARALLPWHAVPNPPAAAAAPRYGGERGTAPGEAPTGAGEALLPDLIALFTDLAAPRRAGRSPAPAPLMEPWRVRHSGGSVTTADPPREYGLPRPSAARGVKARQDRGR
ncbi:hypothetical protein [Streptomyces sp. NPDC053755]|uniref:hypothetical protein n=1 Tax=Streptomyces sp. NPDC053755 TaxID=3155815 RepID=UPI00342AB577